MLGDISYKNWSFNWRGYGFVPNCILVFIKRKTVESIIRTHKRSVKKMEILWTVHSYNWKNLKREGGITFKCASIYFSKIVWHRSGTLISLWKILNPSGSLFYRQLLYREHVEYVVCRSKLWDSTNHNILYKIVQDFVDALFQDMLAFYPSIYSLRKHLYTIYFPHVKFNRELKSM